MVAAISQRNFMSTYRDKKLVEWQTRNISTMLAYTAMTDEKGQKILLGIADDMSTDPADPEDAEKKKAERAEPQVGSFEKLVRGFKIKEEDLRAASEASTPKTEDQITD